MRVLTDSLFFIVGLDVSRLSQIFFENVNHSTARKFRALSNFKPATPAVKLSQLSNFKAATKPAAAVKFYSA